MKWRPYWCTVRELALSYSNISYCFTTPLGPPITWVKTIYRCFAIREAENVYSSRFFLGGVRTPIYPPRQIRPWLKVYIVFQVGVMVLYQQDGGDNGVCWRRNICTIIKHHLIVRLAESLKSLDIICLLRPKSGNLCKYIKYDYRAFE
jgi:hypothetical protein